jgi:uncharacterized protein YecT (DUF1311 family)
MNIFCEVWLMKQIVLVVAFILSNISTAYADYDADFIRISCIPEKQFFSVEYHPIHNPTVDAEADPPSTPKNIWEQHGFYDPANLNYKCKFAESEYKVVASQAPWSNGMCGAAPEIHFSLYRNNTFLLKDVVFGNSCYGSPSVLSVTIEDGKSGWYSREAQICFLSGTQQCQYFFDQYHDFDKFPIDENGIARIVEKSQIDSKTVPTGENLTKQQSNENSQSIINSPPVQSASFDCKKANTKTEQMICSDNEVSKLDADLMKAYGQSLRYSEDKQKDIKEQKQWLKEVRNVCQGVACLKSAYQARIKVLLTRPNQTGKS